MNKENMNNVYEVVIYKNGKPIFRRSMSVERTAATVLAFMETEEIEGDIPEDVVTVSQYKNRKPVVTRGGRIVKHTKSPGKRTTHCKSCGKPGHIAKTCPNPNEGTPETSLPERSFKPISPDTLFKVKDMLRSGDSCEDVAKATGLEVDRVERMKDQLGL